MEPEAILKQARNKGRSTLTETESKKLLNYYGVPVVADAVFTSEDEAISHAQKIGFPIVIKGYGAKLTHKTERGLVKTNLKSVDEVRNAYSEIKQAAGKDWEGCLIQPMIEGKREFVAGLSRDAQFGPVIMFGLGGIFTEALADTTFRISPFDKKQARQMIGEISSNKLLKDFRGEAAADVDQLVAVLLGLAKLGVEQPDIKEVDINPLIITPQGKVIAVDALIVLRDDKTQAVKETVKENKTNQLNAALEVMTHPRSIAVIGATRTHSEGFPGMFANIAAFGYPGKLYPINPNADEILGHKAYPSLVALGKPVDLVVVSVPAPYVPAALRDCVASGNRNVHIFSSGFKETGETEGIRLQEEIEKIAREGGLNVIGPNCMGLYVPASHILTWIGGSEKSGPVAFISQSGGNAQDYTAYAA
jgi:acyl-CoA synthetase (NDP forming)